MKLLKTSFLALTAILTVSTTEFASATTHYANCADSVMIEAKTETDGELGLIAHATKATTYAGVSLTCEYTFNYGFLNGKMISAEGHLTLESYDGSRAFISLNLPTGELAQLSVHKSDAQRTTYGTLFVVRDFEPVSLYSPIRTIELKRPKLSISIEQKLVPVSF